jgi:hypothetical protein
MRRRDLRQILTNGTAECGKVESQPPKHLRSFPAGRQFNVYHAGRERRAQAWSSFDTYARVHRDDSLDYKTISRASGFISTSTFPQDRLSGRFQPDLESVPPRTLRIKRNMRRQGNPETMGVPARWTFQHGVLRRDDGSDAKGRDLLSDTDDKHNKDFEGQPGRDKFMEITCRYGIRIFQTNVQFGSFS